MLIYMRDNLVEVGQLKLFCWYALSYVNVCQKVGTAIVGLTTRLVHSKMLRQLWSTFFGA